MPRRLARSCGRASKGPKKPRAEPALASPERQGRMRHGGNPTAAGGGPMKRPFIDARIDAMLTLCERHGVKLPPFAIWGQAHFYAEAVAGRLLAPRGIG